tara:strand:- start:406 stop:1230 length:825 start_codon:yes stop_codon:yes gene_type:complete
MVKFIKMHGLGNDFVIIRNSNVMKINRNLVQNISDRIKGIGCDLVVFLTDGDGKFFDLKAEFFNSDGSKAEVCGNALRCIGKFYCNKLKKKNLVVETESGIIDVEIIKNGKISVDIGIPKFRWNEIPINQNLDTENLDIKLNYLKGGFALNVGNPHVIFFSDKIEKGKFLRDSKEISNYKIFPEGINISLVEIKTKKEINVITFERGAGLTNACGTGACASVMACHKLNLCDRRVRVNMIGGELDIEISEDRHIFMVGEAKEVFQGEFEIEKLG